MYPIALNLNSVSIALVGGGTASWKRAQALLDQGCKRLDVYAQHWSDAFLQDEDSRLNKKDHLPSDEDLESYRVVMIADIADEVAFEIASRVRAMGRLVNVEDRKDYCDFYFSSLVARGDLLIAVNTGGKSPALSVRIRKFLEKLFPQEWAVYLDELGQKRLEWKEQGMTFSQVNEQSNAYINGKGWLK